MLTHVIIIRDDLPIGIRLAYVTHGAGESVSERVPSGTRAVVLAARDEEHIRGIRIALESSGVPHTAIVEGGEMYSIGIRPMVCEGEARKITSSLALAR